MIQNNDNKQKNSHTSSQRYFLNRLKYRFMLIFPVFGFLFGSVERQGKEQQALSLEEQEQLTDKLAVISYNGGLAESIVHAFGNHSPLQIENAYRGILSQIRKESENGTRILLMIDDMKLGCLMAKSVRVATAPCSAVWGSITRGTPKYSASLTEFMPQWVTKASAFSRTAI